MSNFIFETDSYKLGSHFNMLPECVVGCVTYGEARVGAEFNETLWFGMQAIVMQNLCGVVVTQADLDEAKILSKHHFGSEDAINIKGWEFIINEYGGKLPIQIDSAPEGSIIPVGNMLFRVMETDKRAKWIAQYIEGILMKIWRPTTIATKTYNTILPIRDFINKTSDNPDFGEFAFHDFSFRSATCKEDSALSSAAILLSTKGTDTPSAMKFAHDFYGANYENLAFSCPATEHRIAMHFGKGKGEDEYLQFQMQKYPHGILSIVSDTYNIVNFIETVVKRNKELILQRRNLSSHPLTKVVFRPDSPRFKGDRPKDQCLWLVDELGDIFGYTKNSKGYKTLNPAVGMIYGDGLKSHEIYEIYETLADNGWDCSCMVVGQGGGALDSKRDTQRFAIKPSAEFIQEGDNIFWQSLKKDPLDKSKASKEGLLKLVKSLNPQGGVKWETINHEHPNFEQAHDELVTIFRNGELVHFEKFEDIRKRVGLLS